MLAVLLTASIGTCAYGPFDEDDAEAAERFAAYLTAQVDPARVVPATSLPDSTITWGSPTRELLNWYERFGHRSAEIDRLHGEITKLRAQLRDKNGADTLDILREAVKAEGGNWTTRRADHVFPDRMLTPERCRQLLNALADEGLLIKHGALGRLWTPPWEASDA